MAWAWQLSSRQHIPWCFLAIGRAKRGAQRSLQPLTADFRRLTQIIVLMPFGHVSASRPKNYLRRSADNLPPSCCYLRSSILDTYPSQLSTQHSELSTESAMLFANFRLRLSGANNSLRLDNRLAGQLWKANDRLSPLMQGGKCSQSIVRRAATGACRPPLWSFRLF